MEANHPSQTGDQPGLDRRTFFRRALCDARTEFAQQEGPIKIFEAGLLTTMGAIGLTSGFACLWHTEAEELRVTNRGVDGATITYIQDHFADLQNRCFALAPSNNSAFETGAHFIAPDDATGLPTGNLDLRVLVYWRLGKEMAGFMGLGQKIAGSSIEIQEIDFVLNVVDSMLMALQAATTRAMIRTLENELQQAREQIREGAQRIETAKKELERSLFRLSGFNDIFQELSGLHESPRVIESFLLVLIGIFSAKSGSILYYDADTEQVHIAGRGSGSSVLGHLTSEQIRSQIQSISATRRASALAPMQAEILPPEHLPGSSLQWAKENLVIIFKLNEAANGLLLLGPRLLEARYGPRERELLLAFTHNFLVFLKNSKSFETIERLHAEQEKKNIALQQTVEALSTSRKTIVGLEKTGERIKTLINRSMARSARVSLVDICAVVIAGMILGLVYNFASPGGIPIIPGTWHHASSPQVDILKAKTMFNARAALFIDARPPEFYNQLHIATAVNLPPALFDFIYMMRFNRMDPEQTLVVYGRTISRRYDEEIAYSLRDRGHANVLVLKGGIGQWHSKGLAVEP